MVGFSGGVVEAGFSETGVGDGLGDSSGVGVLCGVASGVGVGDDSGAAGCAGSGCGVGVGAGAATAGGWLSDAVVTCSAPAGGFAAPGTAIVEIVCAAPIRSSKPSSEPFTFR